jgi:hypothetical protein
MSPDPDSRRVDAEHLTKLLRVRHAGVDVTGVDVLGESEGSASRLRLALRYAPGTARGLPPTMFLKRNLARFNFPGEMYSTEVRMYRDVIDQVSFERPVVYAIDSTDDDLTFTILMEDLGNRHGARLGIVTEPVTVDEVSGLLETIAALHAEFWQSTHLDNELSWLEAPQHHAAMRFWRQHGPRLARRHLERGHRAALVDRRVWTDEALWSGFDRFVEVLGDGPHTLLHGDVHAGNVYYVTGGPGGLLDWQLALRGCWALDVTYLLTTALDPLQRAASERDLIDHYRGCLAARGVTPPTADEAWLGYRRHAIYGVAMWLITPEGVHTDDAQRGYLTRCLDAAERLGTLDALGAA